jgi:hypothetical protein
VTEWDPKSEAAGDVLRLLAEISDNMLLRQAANTDRPELQAGSFTMRGLLQRVGVFAGA